MSEYVQVGFYRVAQIMPGYTREKKNLIYKQKFSLNIE